MLSAPRPHWALTVCLSTFPILNPSTARNPSSDSVPYIRKRHKDALQNIRGIAVGNARSPYGRLQACSLIFMHYTELEKCSKWSTVEIGQSLTSCFPGVKCRVRSLACSNASYPPKRVAIRKHVRILPSRIDTFSRRVRYAMSAVWRLLPV